MTAKETSERDRQTRFLAAYVETGSVLDAAKRAGIARRTHYSWIEKRPAYAALFEEAKQELIDRLEGFVYRSATGGIDELVFNRGQLVYMPARDKDTGEVLRKDDGTPILTDEPMTIRKRNDVAAFFLLKALLPQKYRENMTVEHEGDIAFITERLTRGKEILAGMKRPDPTPPDDE